MVYTFFILVSCEYHINTELLLIVETEKGNNADVLNGKLKSGLRASGVVSEDIRINE